MREEWIHNKKKNFENPLSDILSGVIKPILTKQTALEAEILLNWNKIFTSDIAKNCEFQKLTFKSKTSQQCTLHIGVKAAFALEISYKTTQIIEMLNNFIGSKSIEKIIINKV